MAEEFCVYNFYNNIMYWDLVYLETLQQLNIFDWVQVEWNK